MATQSFFVVNAKDLQYQIMGDAVIQGKDKKILGESYKKKAPSGRTFLVCRLEDHWIITNEEYKQLKLWRSNHSQSLKTSKQPATNLNTEWLEKTKTPRKKKSQ